ncbi:MAG: Gfo/Idh/MocA family oxidoreductase [Gemmatimonadaceae bacterium]|nr:Gfo/Idh/MocA family oxidoreductase [Gemmatimonadaceae bacterium]
MAAALGVAIIGTGRVGYQFSFGDLPDNHAEAVAACEDVRLVAGVNRGRDKLDAFGKRFGVDALFHDYRQMLEHAAPEIVIVATHPELHCEMVLQCAAASSVRAIICEKPMALSLEECDRMIAACEAESVLLQVNHNRRWHPEWQLAGRLLADGAVGDLIHIDCFMDGCKPEPSWRSENEGPLLHDYTHYFDLMDLYGGPVAWLCGTAEQRIRPWAVEDYAAAFLKFDSGVTGTIRGAELTTYSDHAFELRGSSGLVRMVGEQVLLQRSEQGMYEPDSGFQWSDLRATKVERPAPASTYVAALAELLAALDGEATLRSDGQVGRRSMEMVTAVYQSQLTGNRPVSFPLSRLDNGIAALRQAGAFRERG